MSGKKSSWLEIVVILFVALAAVMTLAWNKILSIPRGNKKPEGQVMATSLASAVENFYGEYNRLPNVAKELKTDSSGTKLLEILLGLEGTGSGIENTRSVIFLQGKEAKDGVGGIVYGTGDAVEGLFDSYARPFKVVLNLKYEDALIFQYGGKTVELRGKQVAVWSVGKDGIEGTEDDARSWN